MFPARTISVALFACPYCIDEFAFDWQRIRDLAYGWRVRVRCPACGNIVEVVMQGYTVIHHCDPTKYQWGEMTESSPLSPHKKPPDRSLYMAVIQKKYGWRVVTTASAVDNISAPVLHFNA